MSGLKALLFAGVAVPFVYFLAQFAAVALNPTYSILAQRPSELGCCGAHLPWLANAGFVATGAAAILGGAGVFAGVRRLRGRMFFAALSALCLVLFGAAMIMSGVFPLPNPLHYGFGFLIAGVFASLFGALAFKDGGAPRWILLAGFLLTLAIVALSTGLGGLASTDNVGLFSRLIALTGFSSIAYLCWAVMRRLPLDEGPD